MIWQMRSVKKKSSLSEKNKIQANLLGKIGLIVNKPTPVGSGTTNNGSTSRRVFENP